MLYFMHALIDGGLYFLLPSLPFNTQRPIESLREIKTLEKGGGREMARRAPSPAVNGVAHRRVFDGDSMGR
jgi:hypothetical protein